MMPSFWFFQGNAIHTFTERFVQLPKSLIIYLPRTQYWTSEDRLRYSKNREAVEFPETLTLDEFCVENPNPPSEVENSPFKLGKNEIKHLSGEVRKVRVTESLLYNNG